MMDLGEVVAMIGGGNKECEGIIRSRPTIRQSFVLDDVMIGAYQWR
jgi:hypothetical protein